MIYFMYMYQVDSLCHLISIQMCNSPIQTIVTQLNIVHMKEKLVL